MTPISENKLRLTLVEIGRRMYQRGYVAANDGNISASRLGADSYYANGCFQRIYEPRGYGCGGLSGPYLILGKPFNGTSFALVYPIKKVLRS